MDIYQRRWDRVMVIHKPSEWVDGQWWTFITFHNSSPSSELPGFENPYPCHDSDLAMDTFPSQVSNRWQLRRTGGDWSTWWWLCTPQNCDLNGENDDKALDFREPYFRTNRFEQRKTWVGWDLRSRWCNHSEPGTCSILLYCSAKVEIWSRYPSWSVDVWWSLNGDVRTMGTL